MSTVNTTPYVTTSKKAIAQVQQACSDYFRDFEWNLYVTLTFSRELSGSSARLKLEKFLLAIEEEVKAPVACLIAEETKVSGIGQAAGRVHFHLLMWCAKEIDTEGVQTLWEQPVFGGNRTVGKSAHIKPYDPDESAVHYQFKDLRVRGFEWTIRNVDLNARKRPASYSNSARQRRRLRRSKACSGKLERISVARVLDRFSNRKLEKGALQSFPAPSQEAIVILKKS